MRFAGSIGSKAADSAPAGAVRRALPQTDWQIGRPYQPMSVAANVDKFVADTYERVTWVFAAVRAVAHNSARLKIVQRRGDPETGEDIKDHPLLPLLNWRASPFTNEQAYVFRHRLAAQLELSSKGVFVELINNRRGDVIALHLLPPSKVSPIPSATTFVGGYDVTVGYDHITLPPEQVLWIKNPHPLDPFRSMTSFEAAGISIDTDWLARLYNANFMRNDGRGATIVGVKGGLEDEDADEIAAWLRGGVRNAGSTRVIDADDLNVVDLAATPRDAQYTELRGLSKEEIFLGAGVPESSAGNASGRTWDNADVEQSVFWNEKMLGVLELIGGAFDIIDGDPDTFTVHDTSKVPALQRAKQEEQQQWLAEVKAGVRSIDSYLEAIGEKPFGVPQTMVPLISIGTSPLFKVDEQGKPIVTPAPVPPTPPGPVPADALPPPAPNGNTPEPALG